MAATPTATDIAMAWLVARAVFGKGHPAVAFLLLHAVAERARGGAIIGSGRTCQLHDLGDGRIEGDEPHYFDAPLAAKYLDGGCGLRV